MTVYRLLVGLWTWVLRSRFCCGFFRTLDKLILSSTLTIHCPKGNSRKAEETECCLLLNPVILEQTFLSAVTMGGGWGRRALAGLFGVSLWENSFLGKIANKNVYMKKFINMACWFIGAGYSDLNWKCVGLFLFSFLLVFNWLVK